MGRFARKSRYFHRSTTTLSLFHSLGLMLPQKKKCRPLQFDGLSGNNPIPGSTFLPLLEYVCDESCRIVAELHCPKRCSFGSLMSQQTVLLLPKLRVDCTDDPIRRAACAREPEISQPRFNIRRRFRVAHCDKSLQQLASGSPSRKGYRLRTPWLGRARRWTVCHGL